MRKIFSLAACLLLGIGIAACSSSGPAYFLSSAPGLVVLIQWQPPQNGQAVGIVTQVQPSGTAPNQILGVTTVPVDVAINGRAVTLTPTGLGELFGGTSLSGTLSNGGLTITTPPDSSTGAISTGTLPSSSPSAYNAAVTTLRQQITGANAAAAAGQQAQARQSANTAAEQTASNDLEKLSQDASFGADLSSLGSDVRQTGSDLASEKSDAAGGPNADGGDCYNLTANVDYDAVQNVEYDATQDLGYDLQQNLQPAISAVRTDITTVQADQQNLSAAGLPQPPGASTITNTARAAIGHAVTVANGDIAAVNADISQAYALAQGMATGSCAGQGPGPTPQPIAPFS